MKRRTALVAGATGLVGGLVARLLGASGAWSKPALLLRKPGTALPEGCRTLIVDYERIAEAPLPDVDDLFVCLGTTIGRAGSKEAFRAVDYTAVVELSRRAQALGTRQLLVVSSLGADARSAAFYPRVKGEMEETVRTLPFQAVHLFRPSFLEGERAESRPGERLAIGLLGAVGRAAPLLLRRWRPIEAVVVARAMLAAAQREERGVRVWESDEIRELGRPGRCEASSGRATSQNT